MTETLNNFQQEWYESIQKGVAFDGIEKVPKEYEQN